MPSRQLPYPVFDADNHFYEPKEALTKFLPDHRKNVIDYIEVRGRTKIMVRNQVSDYIPNPTFEVVARPGAQEEYFRHGSGGKSFREVMGKPMKAIPAFRDPAARLEVMDGLGLDYSLMFPTLAGLVEAHEGRPRADPRRHPRAQRVDVRDLAVQLRESDLLHTGDHTADRRSRARGTRVVPGARCQNSSGPAGAGARNAGHAVVRPIGVRSVLGGLCDGGHPGVDARLGFRVRGVPQRLGARR